MKYYTDAFDSQLRSIDHFSRYPEMLPFIGNGYRGHGHRQMLIVAESHYLCKDRPSHPDAADWHKGSSANLIVNDKVDERTYIHTREILQSCANQGRRPRAHRIYQHIEKVLIAAGVPRTEFMFEDVAFMNYFTRPAKFGKSMELIATDLDRDHSKEVFQSIVEIIKPEVICVTSSYTWRTAGSPIQKCCLRSCGFPHPLCAWWHRPSKNCGTGKERMVGFVREHWTA